MPPAIPSWTLGTVQPTLPPRCLSSSWKGVSVQPGNALYWDMEQISLSCLACNLGPIFYSCYLARLLWVIPFAHFGPYLASKTCIILLWDAGETSLLEPAAPSWVLSVSPDINHLWLWVTEGLQEQGVSFSSQAQFKEAAQLSKLLFFY